MRLPIRVFCRRLLANLLWLVAAACLLIAAVTPLAAAECQLIAPEVSQLDQVDSTVPLTGRNPLILIHGINRHGVPAPPDCHLWENFIDYYKVQTALNRAYKLYQFSYNSNSVYSSQLGKALRNKIDEANFGNKPISIIAHSLGGLIAREFMRLDAGGDPFTGPRGGDKVFRLITLGTPHHGVPLLNAASRLPGRTIIGTPTDGIFASYLNVFDVIHSGRLRVLTPNRVDLLWDNLVSPHLFYDTPVQVSEKNDHLAQMNNEEQYQNKIIAYAGKTDSQTEAEEEYRRGAFANEFLFLLESDGIVPTDSALFEGKNILKAKLLPEYNHSQIAQGKCPPRTDCPDNLFGKIRDDLLVDTSGPYSNLVPLPETIALSSATLSPGQSFTANWQLANQGAAAANAASTTVVRINRSPTSAGPINNLASVRTPALAAGVPPVPQTATLRAPVTAGTYYVWVIADNFNEVTNQGPNFGDDRQHSLPFTVTAPAVPLTVAGIAASYSTPEAPFRQTINLTGSGFSSINQISWACTMPGGTSCGAIPLWTPANWNGKFTLASDTAATISPVLLVTGDPTGVYQWSVTFSNATNYVTKNFSVSFNPVGNYATSTALGVAPNPGTAGQPVSFAASVVSGGGIPTGTVTFREGATVLGTGTLSNGLANFSTSSLAVGTHTVTADYSGVGNFLASTSNSVGAVIQPPAPQFTVAPSSGAASGQQGGPFPSIEFQVSAPGGSINFSVDQKPYWLDVSPANGVASSSPTAVVFTVNADGRSLSPGVYAGEVFFAINGGGVGSIFRNVMLTVSAQAGALQVSAGDMSTAGPQYGPFVPDTFNYQLSATSGSIGFSISGWPSWLTPLTTSGTATTTPTTVTFLVNSNAQTMAPGTYGPSTVAFTNTTNGQGTTSRNATLAVSPLPTLQVTPASDMSISGSQGGPFSPLSFSYTLSSAVGDVGFSISFVPSWLTASSTSGTATATGTTVTFTVNSSAASLPPGGYSSTILFSNTTNGRGNQTRFATLLVRATGTGPSFQGLGFLPGDSYSLALGVSADGNVAVGYANQRIPGDEGRRAFRWTPENGMVSLGVLPGAGNSEAFGANADGSVVVGTSGSQAFRWANGTMSGLGYLSGGNNSTAYGVNSDGSVVVGSSFSGGGVGGQAFRWVNGVMRPLGFLEGNDLSVAYGTNADGSVVVGGSCSSNPGCHGVSSVSRGSQAFLWSNGTMTGLRALPGGGDSTATAVNADGSVAVGSSVDNSGHNYQAFRYANGTMTGLGFLPGSNNSGANAISADGRVVVGQSNGAFRWTPAEGMKSVAELLTAAGVNVNGWSLGGATGVSADGTVIVGFGNNPSGRQEGWIARLPLPVPTLQVSPAIGFSATGDQGGPFSPAAFSYQLTASSGTVDYTVTNVPSWLTASPTSGTVDSSGTTITFTVNSSANSLATGSYSPLPIMFTNTTSGQGNTTRAATLSVNPPPPGALQVTPPTGVSASGTQGGTFSPPSFSYKLSSTSGSVGYSISGVPSWITVSSASGTATTAETTITFAVNASANSLSPGSYDSSITFTNTTNDQGSQSRAATLTIVAPPPPPARLRISPLTNIAAWGKRGGPFTPSSFSFQLSASHASVNYSISGVPNWLTASAPLSGTVTVAPTTVNFTLNNAAASLAPGSYSPPPITITNTTNGQGNTSRTIMLSVAPPLFQGTATLLSATAACSAVTGLSVGGLIDSAYRPRMNPSEPESGLILKFAGSTASLFRASGDDQMRGAGTYFGHWVSDRATSTGNLPIMGSYNFSVAPTPLSWGTQFVEINGTITTFINISGCDIVFRGAYERAPD